MNTKIVISDVKKNFRNLPVVGGVSLSVNHGEFVVLVGPSGCGKSTLMKMIAGFEPPSEGAITIDGIAIRGPSRKRISLSQQGSVFPWMTVHQNLMFGLIAGQESHKSALVGHYLELVGLKEFEQSYPHELSGGMRKRVELARALTVKPEILLMDEPFAALDALMSLKLRNELLRILSKERCTVLLVTHDIEEALFVADRIVVLSARPARIQATFEMRFPHPRKLSLPEFQQIKQQIMHELGVAD